jgi:AraC-like DNA-binding protein
MSIDLINVIFLWVGLAQAVFALAYLLFFKEMKTTSIFFGLFLIVFISPVIDHLLATVNPITESPRFFYTPTGFYFFVVPIYYLYYLSLFEKLKAKKIILLLIPGILEFAFMTFMFCMPEDFSTHFRENNLMFFYVTYGFGLPIFSIFLLSLIIFRINKYHNKYLDFFSSTQKVDLNWLIYTTVFLLISYFFQLVTLFSFLDNSQRGFISLMDSILSLVFLYWITIFGIKQNHIPSGYKIYLEQIILAENSKSITVSDISEFNEIEEIVRSSKCFKNPNLTVIDLAELVDKHPKKVSQLINQYSNNNFNKYINKFRVEEAKKLLLDSNFENLTIEAISAEAGFKSKSVFNTFFKLETTYTPKEFKNNNGSQVPSE